MFNLFQDTNVAQGLPAKGQFQAGVSDFDPEGLTVERDVLIPIARDPEATWVYYETEITCFCDSGIVVHRHLPQGDYDPATLASCFIDDANIDKLTGRGVNLKGIDSYSDTVQRMAHTQYWFRLFGQAMRIGHQVPIPGIKTIGGVPAIPHDDNPQMAYNKIVGNYSGSPLWYAAWSLWYTTAVPPAANQTPPPNLAAHIAGDVTLPTGMQAPFSQPDDEAESTNPLGSGTIRPRATP